MSGCVNIYYYIKKAIFLSFLMIAARCQGQYTASASLDTNTVLIGKQARISLELKGKRTFPVAWPMVPDTIGKIEVISRGSVDTLKSASGEIHLKQVLSVTAFDSGYFVIPPFSFSKPSSGEVMAETNPLLLTVQMVPVDTTKAFKDIKNIAEVPYNWRDYIGYVAMVLLAIALIVAGIIIYRRIKKNRKVPFISSPKPEIPPHQIALAALKQLDEGKHWQNGQYKFYHSTLSNIIRGYIESRWNIPAMEQTTDEILSSQLSFEIPAEAKQKLNYILRIADLAKFAKLQPLAHENEQSMREAVAFVEETKSVVKEAGEVTAT